MTKSDSVTPDAVLEALLSQGARRDKLEKLRTLHELCSLEYGRRPEMRDLSKANMSKIAESHGLFKARAIYNEPSKDYRTLIEAWETYTGDNSNKAATKRVELADKYAFLKKIDDPAVRSLCQLGLIERDKLKAELNMVKSQVAIVVDMRPLGATITPSAANVTIVEMVAQLTDSERKALSSAIAPKFLSDRQWRIGKTGEVLDLKGRFVFFPGFATGIKKILGDGAPPEGTAES